MKILVISNLYPPYYLGGYELGCKNVVDGLIEKGHEVFVLTTPSHVRTNSASRLEEPGSSSFNPKLVFRRLQLRSFQPVKSKLDGVEKLVRFESMVSNYTNTCAVLDALNEFKPDIVYLFNLVGIGGLAILDALNSKRVPWLIYLMDDLPSSLQSGFNKLVLSVFNAIDGKIYDKGHLISMSRNLVAEIESKCGFNFTSQMSLIPGWAKTDELIYQRPYGGSGVVRFVTAGAVKPHKGIDIILKAASLLKQAGVSNFTIDIYGEGDVGYYVDMSKSEKIADLVRFCGSRTQGELSDIYKSSDAFLFPTWEREPFGFAPVEAAAVGCIPIITSTGGVAERLIHNVNCLKIDRNESSLASTMRRFCENEIDCQRIGLNAQLITREDLSFGHCLRQIESALRHRLEAADTEYQQSNWRDFNLAYLKHNLSFKMSL